MNYPLLFQAVYFEPLCVESSVFRAVHAVLWPRIMGGKDMAPAAAEAGKGFGPNDKAHRSEWSSRRATYPRPSYDQMTGRIQNDEFFYRMPDKPGVAVVPIYGLLTKNAGALEQMCYGVTDINPAAHAVQQASEAKDVTTIVLDIASPGGQTTGIKELAQQVRAAVAGGKTVYAFSDERFASAAYWIGSQATEIYVTASSTVGSIGTYIAWLDESLKMQIEGLRLEYFGAGKHKAMGLPGKELKAEDRQLLQSKVDKVNGWFTSGVSAARPMLAAGTMEGQTFTGEEAVEVGLADGLVNSWDEFLKLL